MRNFSPLMALLAVALVLPASRVWAADPPKSNASAGATDQNQASGYSDRRDAEMLPERKERRDYVIELSDLLKARKFEELNAIYEKLIKTKARFSTGEAKLAAFYYGVTSWRICPPNQRPLALFKLVREWKEKHPGVLAPQLAEVIVQHDYAWYTRGGGYANTVTPANAKRYQARLVRTHELLDNAVDKQGQDPHLHVVAINVGRSSGAPIPEMREQLDMALAIDPDYFPAYGALGMSLLQRWYGAPGDLEAFLDEAVERTKEKWGQSVYAALAMRTNKEGSQIFTKTKVDWNRMKAGFEDLHRRFPDVMTYPNQCCRYALYADDRETATRMFNLIGDNFDRDIWRARVLFDRQRKLTIEGETRPESQIVLDLPTYVYSMHFHPETGYLYTAIASRGLVGWDPINGKFVEKMSMGQRRPHRFDFSGDGEKLALTSTLSELVLRNTLTGKDIASVKLDKVLNLLCLAADGSLIAGARQRGADVYLFEVETQKLHRFTAGDSTLFSMALSPDAKILATGNRHQQLHIWSVPEGRELKRVSGFNFAVAALAFSPDGKTLAVGHANNERPAKGMISLYDVATWEKTADIQAHEKYVTKVCFSPDGKLLASGCFDGRVKLWEVEGLKLRGELTDHVKRVVGLAFSPDGQQLATTSNDLTTRISDISQPPLGGEQAEP